MPLSKVNLLQESSWVQQFHVASQIKEVLDLSVFPTILQKLYDLPKHLHQIYYLQGIKALK